MQGRVDFSDPSWVPRSGPRALSRYWSAVALVFPFPLLPALAR